MLSKNALRVLEKRYLLKDEKGRIIETPDQMFKRVAKHVSKSKKEEKEFYEVMKNLEFLPNSPTLMNAGTSIGQLSACFVLPIEDSLESIFSTLKSAALIHQSGGGTGFSFSEIRPKGDIVKSTKGAASGPLSFMQAYDMTTHVIRQGGKRRGANMGILRIDHPDIIEFIKSKEKEGNLANFNISVAMTEKFMKAVQKNKNFELINPKTKKAVKKINAKKLFDILAEMAWKTGDPGIIFIDEINKKHPLKSSGKIESTNPCGEVPLLPYESCNLGSINLTKFVSKGRIDYNKLKNVINTAVNFLDNVIDANKYPLKKIEKITKANRKIGLGVMGFADMLIMLGVRYDSDKALKIADELMKFISETAVKASVELAKKRGSFPNFKKSEWVKKYKSMRNATVTSIAPTGSISIIADCSSGIEPLFATKFARLSLGKEFFYEHPLLKKYNRKLFVIAHQIAPEGHVKMQAIFQKYTDNGVSKTVNLKQNATKEDVKKIFLLAYKLKCKGITVYREGSKKQQVLNIGKCKVCK
ncbi:ribonucleoside-diphosphate reductase class II [Thermoplasmatales archaeon SCGC AB-539-C06]|nr:ribonucleoside-diphosphate reductase class II [Thermoplasmatales archaeon SCGC AB-539-C06]